MFAPHFNMKLSQCCITFTKLWCNDAKQCALHTICQPMVFFTFFVLFSVKSLQQQVSTQEWHNTLFTVHLLLSGVNVNLKWLHCTWCANLWICIINSCKFMSLLWSPSICSSLFTSIYLSTQFWKAISLSKTYVNRVAHSSSNMVHFFFIFMSFTYCHFINLVQSHPVTSCAYTKQITTFWLCVRSCKSIFVRTNLSVRPWAWGHFLLWRAIWGLRLFLMAEVSIRCRLRQGFGG